VLKHESKCKHLHGHRYVAEVTVTAEELDSLGRIIDFGVVKQLVGGWIDANWDHNMIFHPDDPLLKVLVNGPLTMMQVEDITGGKRPFVLDSNPTAENLARVLFQAAGELLQPYDIRVVRVRLHETPNCFATFYG
jgi:6-pyruvoyltetrahydropterin/6-carboxytetrahydropterin synthase